MDEERGGFGVMGPEDRFVIGRYRCGGDMVLRGLVGVVVVVGRGELENGGRIAVSVVVEVEGMVMMWTREHVFGC
jgi:hypothetical protein